MLLSIWLTPQRRTKKNILKILGTKKDKFKFGGQKKSPKSDVKVQYCKSLV